MKILVASENPVKISASHEAFSHYFPDTEAVGHSVPSGVGDQPIHEETFVGAANRAQNLFQLNRENQWDYQYLVGIEGGIIELHHHWFCFGAICLMDTQQRTSFGQSPHFPLPPQVVKELIEGKAELGTIIDRLSGGENTKQKGGAIAFLTQGVIDRKALYVSGIVSALVPFVQSHLFFPNS